MNRSNTRREATWASWSLSILLHLAIVGIVAGVWFWSQRHRPPQPLAIEGSVVTAEELAQLSKPAPAPVIEDPPPVVEVEPEAEPEPLAEAPPPEPDPAQLQAQAEAAAEAERQEQQRLLAQRAEEDARVEAERVRKQREEEQRQRAEREKAEREKAERERVERERQARERAERERREREASELARREQELAAQLAAEQQRAAVRKSPAARQYMDLIRARVERAWVRPPSVRVGLTCEVRVTQIPGGTVTGVSIGRCNGDDAVRQSIEDAVRRASPLPQPPDPALFERELIFNFAPEN